MIYHSTDHLSKVNYAIKKDKYLSNNIFHNHNIQTADDLFCSAHAPMYSGDTAFEHIITSYIENIGVPRTIYNLHRIYFCIRMSLQAFKLNPSGIFIECGVGCGMTSLSLLEYYKYTNLISPEIYLFDTFEGIPQLESTDPYPGGSLVENQKRFQHFSNAFLIQGILPMSLSKIEDKINNIAFAHIDLNNGKYESEVLSTIIPFMRNKGIIVFDDYNFVEFEKSKEIIDSTCDKLNIMRPIGLPFGSAFLIV